MDFAHNENKALASNIENLDGQVKRLRDLLAEADRATRDHLASSRNAQDDNQEVINDLRTKLFSLEKELA